MTDPSELRIAILMMQKDEAELLPAFLRYHASLFGHRSLFIFDNGSNDPRVHSALREAASRGANVFWQYSSPDHFIAKGDIFSGLIKRLDREDRHDFYFPLDCDEFLACLTDAGPSCRKDLILKTLLPLRGDPAPLAIRHKYVSSPIRRNHYKIYIASPKSFFASDACDYLDHGFHHARSRAGLEAVETEIVYFEFHNLTYRRNLKSAAAKIIPYHRDLSRHVMRGYAAKQADNFHCARELLQSKYEYISQFSLDHYDVRSSCPVDIFVALGVCVDDLYETVPFCGIRIWLLWLRLRSQVVAAARAIAEALAAALHGMRWRCLVALGLIRKPGPPA